MPSRDGLGQPWLQTLAKTTSAVALLILGLAGPAAAEGLVMVMAPDGSLRTHEDAQGLLLFGREDVEEALPELARGPAPRGRSPAPEVLAEIETTAMRYAGHAGVRQAGLSASDWLLLYQANIEIESAYDPRAVSPVGAIGLGQIMPATASLLEIDPHDWRQNLDGSARYLLTQLHRFGSPELALAAYNAGPEAVTRYGGIPPYDETQGHVRKVLSVLERLRGESGL